MSVRGSKTQYGWLAIVLHWLMAPAIIGLFFLGWWMRSLTYYDAWYREGPILHKSIGILLLAVLLVRLLWKLMDRSPAAEAGTPRWQALAARLTHVALYALLLVIMTSGYLISTADGRPIEVFDWFSVPATIQGIVHQEDIAGQVHKFLAWSLMALVSLHALAALKHHFIDRDATLRRMLGLAPKPDNSTTLTTQ
ncbi:cytochrome b [Microbulbifer hainanensis]|uniref:cytochrome b n=1 Tax=Microbulbifer hainanensis TaxID=2735675 RepID=UPI00186969AD|nr:cytochrome b [Microbulbifer hainanensis]